MTVSPILAQVMKVIMTLAVEEAGQVHYIKRPGALLEAGCVIARLELDDPTKVKPVSLLGAGHAAVPSCLLPNSILQGIGDTHWGTNGGAALTGASAGMCPHAGTGWHSHGHAASPSQLRWGSSGCSACHGVALRKHPMHAYLVCRSLHAIFSVSIALCLHLQFFCTVYMLGHWQRHEAEC